MSEAEEIEASALSLPEFPTVEQQIRSIEERQAALYAGETAIPADVIDEVLRKGGNKDRSHLRIIYNFMIEQTPEEYTDFVRREYGTGGIGLPFVKEDAEMLDLTNATLKKMERLTDQEFSAIDLEVYRQETMEDV